jgi:hypothetical protein
MLKSITGIPPQCALHSSLPNLYTPDKKPSLGRWEGGGGTKSFHLPKWVWLAKGWVYWYENDSFLSTINEVFKQRVAGSSFSRA